MKMSDLLFMRLNIKALSLTGLWERSPFKNSFIKFLFRSYGKAWWIYLVLFNISEFIEMYYVKSNFPLLMQNLGVSLLYAVLVLKVYVIIFRRHRIKRLFDQIRNEELRALQRSSDEQEMYFESIKKNNFITKLFICVCGSTISMFYITRPLEYFVMGPQEKYHYKIPWIFSSWFPFDKYSSTGFKVAYGSQMVSGALGAYYVSVGDTFYCSFMIFAIGQFKMLQCAIRRLHLTDDEKDHESNLEDMDVWPKIVDCVQHHCRIIDYLADFDSVLNPIIFLKFFACSMMICAVGLEGIIEGPSIHFAMTLYYLQALLIQVFLYYWHANEATLESINVGQAVADCQWYKFTKKDKQGLLMILTRTMKQSELSIGGFYPMSLSTYLMIMRGTYSYIALFRRVYSRNQDQEAAAAAANLS